VPILRVIFCISPSDNQFRTFVTDGVAQ
jgi:hypothetical protein